MYNCALALPHGLKPPLGLRMHAKEKRWVSRWVGDSVHVQGGYAALYVFVARLLARACVLKWRGVLDMGSGYLRFAHFCIV